MVQHMAILDKEEEICKIAAMDVLAEFDLETGRIVVLYVQKNIR